MFLSDGDLNENVMTLMIPHHWTTEVDQPSFPIIHKVDNIEI